MYTYIHCLQHFEATNTVCLSDEVPDKMKFLQAVEYNPSSGRENNVKWKMVYNDV